MPRDRGGGEPVGTGRGDVFTQALREFYFDVVRRRRGRGTLEDLGTAAAAQVEPAFEREGPVSLGDRVEVQPQIDREPAYGRQDVPRHQGSSDQQRADRVGYLPVERNRGVQARRSTMTPSPNLEPARR